MYLYVQRVWHNFLILAKLKKSRSNQTMSTMNNKQKPYFLSIRIHSFESDET